MSGSLPPFPPAGVILVDCPLNGDGLDISGNGNHLTAGSSVQWATNSGRYVFFANSDSSYFDLNPPTQGSYINNFRLEVEANRQPSTKDGSNIIDGCSSANLSATFRSDGIFSQFQNSGSQLYLQIMKWNGTVPSNVNKTIIHINNFAAGNWYKINAYPYIFLKKCIFANWIKKKYYDID